MKKLILLVSAVVLPLIIFTSCDKEDGEKGMLNLSITDAPIDAEGITGVYITVNEIQYHTNENDWQVFEEFEGPKSFNLLDLQRGDSELLGSFELEQGTYTQIRFMLDAPLFGAGPMANPGCYLEFEDGSTQDLFVPSGSQSGYKATGAFKVPANGTVDVTADWDVRKAVVKAGASGKYILKPTIRLVVDDQAGQIAGSVSGIPEDAEIVIYAYEDGVYDDSETDEPAEEQTRFPNAVNSDVVDESGAYYLAYLAPGTYDLVVATTENGVFTAVLGIVENVSVESKSTNTQEIDIANF